jgi:hypothetical protein
MKAQHRTWKIKDTVYRTHVKRWAAITRELVRSSTTLELLPNFYRKKKELRTLPGQKEMLDITSQEIPFPDHMMDSALMRSLEEAELITIERQNGRNTICHFASTEAAKFIGTGDWLEFYVWNEVINAGLADDKHCQWGCLVYDGEIEKEFDLVLIYKAQLIIAECKAVQYPFKARDQYIPNLAAKTNVLGGSYVSKVFITNQPAAGDSLQPFMKQADQYQIRVVTAEELPDIARIMDQEAKNPKYRRI